MRGGKGSERINLKKESPGFHSDQLSSENTKAFVKGVCMPACVCVCVCACVSGQEALLIVVFCFSFGLPFSPPLSLLSFLGSFL